MDHTAARSSTRRPVVFRDGLGRRCRVPDQAGNEKLEILCLRSELTVAEQFEPALRERVARLASFHSADFSRLKTVERLRDPTSTLVLVSETVQGTRLSDFVTIAERRGFGLEGTAAWCLVRRLVSAIATLHEEAADVAHGAIATERIVITPDLRLVVVEYALASALKHVRLSHEQFWKELRVACPRSASAAPLDHRADITQIGVVALSLLLGRALRDDEYPSQISKLVDAAAGTTVNGEPMPGPLQSWLQRALQLKGRESFASAIEASALLDEALSQSHYHLDVDDLEAFVSRCQEKSGPVPVATPAPEATAAPSPAPAKSEEPAVVETAAASESPAAAASVAATPVAPEQPAPPVAVQEASAPKAGPRLVSANPMGASNPALQFPPEPPAPEAEKPASSVVAKTDAPAASETPAAAPAPTFGSQAEAPAAKSNVWRRTAAAAALLTVISGAGWAAASHYFDVSAEPGAAPIASTATAPNAQYASSISPNVSPAQPALETVAATATSETSPAATPASDTFTPPAAAAPVAPSGWVTVSAPADLQVFEKGMLLGSSQGGRVALTPGTHQLELVSDVLGYRGIRSVQVRSGETAAVKIDLPNGTIALNATPWAEVLIDGRSVGETPIGNLSISAGQHEVVFRHPELGEQRTVATVTLSAPTRLSIDMRKR